MSNDTVEVCPECDASSIAHTSQSNHGGTHSTQRYRCTQCNHIFTNPDTRKRQNDTQPGNKGMAKLLGDADPDAWP
jgi:transposase-like protein